MNRRQAIAAIAGASLPAGATPEVLSAQRPLAVKVTLPLDADSELMQQVANQWGEFSADTPLAGLPVFIVRRGFDDVEVIEDPRGR